jgi:SAM-dependent methyltransferase
MPVLIAATLGALIANQRTWWWLVLHLAAFGVVAMVCHRELAERRPAAGNLTRFYLWISLGGALGGLFNALVAPLFFTQIVEFPVVLALAAFLRPTPFWRKGALEPWPVVAGIPIVAFTVTMVASLIQPTADVSLGMIATSFWIVAALGLAFANRTQPFAVAAVILAVAYLLHPQQPGNRVIYATRTFFGVHRVLENIPATQHRLTHGTTLHGWQNLDQRDRCTPTSYYYPTGPIAQVFEALGDRAKRVGVIGLGAGGLVCYSRPGASWTFFEIDPAVERIARDPVFFTFLKNAKADVNVVVGDGRLTLAKTDPATFDVLVMDAFSSDAIPMHLLTREFIASAFDRLKPGGVLAYHVSNVYFDLQPVLAASMRSLGATTLAQYFHSPSPDGLDSEWMIASRDPAALDAFAHDPRWAPPRAGQKSWTDDFSNIFDAINWRR